MSNFSFVSRGTPTNPYPASPESPMLCIDVVNDTLYVNSGQGWTEIGSGTSGINQLTGDVTAGPGTGSAAATLNTVNSNVGSFTNANITVNAKGLVTAAANGSASGAAFSTPHATPFTDPNGGTTYTLPTTSVNPTGSFYFVNGIKKVYGTFYTISGTTLTILGTPPTTGDTHEVYYS